MSASAKTITGGEAIVQALLDHKVDTVFGVPGAQMYALFDALQQKSSEIRTIGARHEQTCAYMAYGYAKASGKPGVYSVVPGPGMLNTTAAISTAWANSTPILCLTGQVPSAYIGKGRGHLHELPDQLATMKTLTKWARRIDSPADAPLAVAEAFAEMTSGRPQPVALEMAWDHMLASASVPPTPSLAPRNTPEPDADALERAAALIAKARHPMIMVGGGAQHASEAIRALAEELGAPVAAFRSGRGIVGADHPLSLMPYGAFQLWPETDLLLGIGTRLEMPYMRWRDGMTLIDAPEAPPHVIRIDVDPAEMERLKPHVGIVADADAGARALLEAVRRKGGVKRQDVARIEAARAKSSAEMQNMQPQLAYLEVIRAVLPRDGIFCDELSQMGFASWVAFPVYEPRTFITAGFQGTLGSGFPTALGAKVAQPDRAVVSITGDGGFMFGVQDLATAVQYEIGLVTILFNNNAFGNVRRDQQNWFAGRLIGSELVNPDFLKLAEAFGAAGYRVHSPAELKPALEKAIADNKPALIEVVVERGSETTPWTFVHPRRS